MFGNRKPNKDSVINALKSINGATIDNVMIGDKGQVRAIISCDSKIAPQIEIAANQALKGIKGVKETQIILTGEKAPAKQGTANTEKIAIDAKHVIAISSGKGGVGKSTVAMNIAHALSQTGKKVGLLDADIYGPSVPKMTGLSGQKPEQNDQGKIIPLHAHGMDIMSIGFMVDEDNPLIWRGPMVQSAVIQMLRDVAWDGLDTLIIDMPPGTGDVQLSLSQRAPLTGAIIVSTPQDIALIDARKGLEMFKKTNIPLLGLIENMSYYCCPECGHKDDIFGHGGAKAEAEKLGIPFLGAIPLNAAIRKAADNGQPVPDYYKELIKELP